MFLLGVTRGAPDFSPWETDLDHHLWAPQTFGATGTGIFVHQVWWGMKTSRCQMFWKCGCVNIPEWWLETYICYWDPPGISKVLFGFYFSKAGNSRGGPKVKGCVCVFSHADNRHQLQTQEGLTSCPKRQSFDLVSLISVRLETKFVAYF